MSDRQRRLGLNEAVFREVNERLEELNLTFAEVTDRIEIVCECGDVECTQMISIRLSEYEEMRTDPTQFALVPGHDIAGVDIVLHHREGYDLVRKKAGDAADAAIETDPRS
jgi:hypothetical protein